MDNFECCQATIIIYGSNIYDEIVISDLDVCIIVQSQFQYKFKDFEKFVKNFSKDNNMNCDEEVPFCNKLVYTFEEINEIIERNPFITDKGAYVINPVEKTSSFLGSKEMRERLILNILTTEKIILSGDKKRIKELEEGAWKVIIDSIINFYNLTYFDLDSLLELMHKNPHTKAEGEFYLGYKRNHPNKVIFLENKLSQMLKKFYGGNDGKPF